MRKYRGVPPLQDKTLPKGMRVTKIEQATPDRFYELKPVLSEQHSEVILWDIFAGDEWCGSRRTPEQCHSFMKHKMDTRAGIEPASPDLQSVA